MPSFCDGVLSDVKSILRSVSQVGEKFYSKVGSSSLWVRKRCLPPLLSKDGSGAKAPFLTLRLPPRMIHLFLSAGS